MPDLPLKPVDLYLRDFAYAQELRRPWEPVWRDITDMVLPRKSFWDTNMDSSGKKAEAKKYDSTAQDSAQILCDGLQGYSVSPSFKWFKLKMQDNELNNLPFVQDWLEDAEDVIYSELNLSEFYGNIGEYYLDACTIGTAIMYVEDRVHTGRTLFTTIHPKECFISENRRGQVDVVWRKFKVRLQDLVDEYGKEALSDWMKDRYEHQPLELVEVVHGVFPRALRDPEKKDAKNKKYVSVYIDEKGRHIIKEGGYDTFPYLVWRYRKNTREVYGRSIAHDALPDILRLNQMAKDLLMAGQLHARPPLNVPQNMKGKVRMIPNGENYMDQTGQKLETVQLGGAFPYGWEELQDLRNQIRELFHVSFFLLLNSVQAGGKMTATEVMERQGEKAAVLGVTIGRLNSECLAPLIDRVFFQLLNDMEIPPPPEELIRRGGRITLEFMGPLAQAQRRYHKSQGVNATLQLLGGMVEIEGAAKQSGSTVIDNADLDELYRIGADSSGSPQKGIREKPEVDQIRVSRVEQQQAAMQQEAALEQQKMLASNAEKLNQPLQRGSMLDKVTGGR